MLTIPNLSGLVFDASQHESIIHPKGNFWVFAYGSLMWNPEFDYLRCETAHLHGYHRSLCLWTVEYRGTVKQPGLVMGLDNGGSCRGRAFLICEKAAPDILAMLNEREMITGAYASGLRSVRLTTGEQVDAVCLFARHDHPQYAARLDLQTKVEFIRQAQGTRGSNRDYVLSTAEHLRELGIVDRSLQSISDELSD